MRRPSPTNLLLCAALASGDLLLRTPTGALLPLPEDGSREELTEWARQARARTWRR